MDRPTVQDGPLPEGGIFSEPRVQEGITGFWTYLAFGRVVGVELQVEAMRVPEAFRRNTYMISAWEGQER
jgi:hypothetical protein